jgi:hypothetical protein
MRDDGRADVPDTTGSAFLDEATLRALIEHVPVTVYIDRLDETGSNVYTSPRLVREVMARRYHQKSQSRKAGS